MYPSKRLQRDTDVQCKTVETNPSPNRYSNAAQFLIAHPNATVFGVSANGEVPIRTQTDHHLLQLGHVIGHAETGRVWQSRRFWELADKELNAGGELLALHDAYRAADIAAGPAATSRDTAVEGTEMQTEGESAKAEITADSRESSYHAISL